MSHDRSGYRWDAASTSTRPPRWRRRSVAGRRPIGCAGRSPHGEARPDVPVTDSLHIVFDVRRLFRRAPSATDVQVRNDPRVRGGRAHRKLWRHDTARQRRRTAAGKTAPVHVSDLALAGVEQGRSQVNVVHDPAYMARAGAVKSLRSENGCAGRRHRRRHDDAGGARLRHSGAGGRPGSPCRPRAPRGNIGPLTAWNAIDLARHAKRRRGPVALAQADGAGSVPWHMFDRAANDWIKVTKYPKIWNDERAPGDRRAAPGASARYGQRVGG